MKSFTKKQLPIWLSVCLAGGVAAPGFANTVSSNTADNLITSQGEMVLNQQILVEELIKRNAQILFSELQAELAQHQIMQERGAFEANFFSSVRYDDVRRQAEASDKTSQRLPSDFSVFEEQRSRYEIGVNSRVRTGADIRVSYETLNRENNTIGSITNTNNDAEWTGSINLVITQPLMRGLGATQEESRIAQAELEHQILISQYQQQLMRSMFDGLSAYWQLYRVDQIKKIREESLANANNTFKDLERRVRAGQLPETTLLEARSNILSRQAELDASINAYDEARSRLKTLLNISALEQQNLSVRLLDEPDATAMALQGSFADYYSSVLNTWPSYAVALMRSDVQNEQLRAARDQLKPQLDLQVGYSTNGLGFDYGKSAEKQFSTDFPSWFAGLSITMPLQGNQRARAQELSALTRLSQSEIDTQAIRTGLANDLQNRLTQVERSHSELMGYRDNVELLQDLLRIERELFDAGSRRLSDVYDREDRLNRAMQMFVDAKVKYELAKLSLQLAEGSLLGRFGVNVGNGQAMSDSPVRAVRTSTAVTPVVAAPVSVPVQETVMEPNVPSEPSTTLSAQPEPAITEAPGPAVAEEQTAAVDNSRYALIRVATHTSETHANDLVRQLERQFPDHEVSVRPFTLSNGRQAFSVRLGPIYSEDQVASTKAAVDRRFNINSEVSYFNDAQ